tara:strand:+ start:24316 stop:25275 length:960 start_codon:yes stop_codon:yes gene_type:complete
LSRKSALILGCKGQDGSLLCHSLLNKGYRVVGTSRSEYVSASNLSSLGIEKDVEVKKIEITDFIEIKKIIEKEKPQEIYNLAAQSSVGASFSQPIETSESIVMGTVSLLEAAKKSNYTGKIFFSGSGDIFGNTEKAAVISDTQKPNSPYAIGKQCSLNLVKFYREVYGINCLTGILFNHESPFRNSNYVTHKIIHGAIECYLKKKEKIYLGNINIARDWGWAEEYVEAMQLMLSSKISKDQVICTGILTTLKEFIEITFKKLNLDYRNHLISDPQLFRETDIKISYGNPQGIEKDLGWKATVKIDEIIDRLIKSKLDTI